ncbi:hypothetical protein [Pontibacter oryzae]|uniref:STAS/SEC14 domain-containing protein n=1 Tax=Pontibacter oryzae TaxID=2304593 RepID=A0A399SEC3_9BACT|nr:hypothetical protein [Pontibacter oryzae]RIJ41548.1 hypothetical protein D1627_05800 [Pontibacter oryzae]
MIRNRTEILYRDTFIALEYNAVDNWIYVNWKGYQNYDTVVAGCEKILELMKAQACYRILNDNTRVEGQWSAAAKWGADVWFPAMFEAGLKSFAWIYSPSTLSRLSTDKTLKLADFPKQVKVFDDLDLAQDWLRLQV